MKKVVLRPVAGSKAQTFVFFLLAFGVLFLLCGLAIDSGLLYLAKARLSRAVDGAALAAVGNFHQSTNPATNRQDVATIMRNFAVANYSDLGTISTTATEVPTGTTSVTYTYNFNDGTTDPNGQYRRFLQVVLNTGSGGQITSASCNARCPVHTYFMQFSGIFPGIIGNPMFKDIKVSSSAVATRNPRLIMVVVDRSASMLQPGGGAFGLPQAIMTFLNFFDPTSDYIGMVSFGSNARLEMALTTNFLEGATNNMFENGYTPQTNTTTYYGTSVYGIPAADPEQVVGNSDYDPNYYTTGVRRLKFGGDTAADEGIRMGLEQMMANSGFNDPDVTKYMVIFTDGAWNTTRTLLAAPGYTNIVAAPTSPPANAITVSALTYGAIAELPVPTLSPLPGVSNAIAKPGAPAPYAVDYATLAPDHLGDVWQSVDGSTNEPISGSPSGPNIGNSTGTPVSVSGAYRNPMTVTSSTFLTNLPAYSSFGNGPTPYTVYTTSLNVWLPPGSVDYVMNAGTVVSTYVSNFNNPTNTVNIELSSGQSNVLVVPGYVADGNFMDGIDLPYPDNPSVGYNGYPRFSANNYVVPFMWPDDKSNPNGGNYMTDSLMRDLMFRNYANLLTGFYVFRPDDPLGTGIEHFTGATRPLNGLGAYYPGAGFYWPFDLVGIDPDPTFCLTNATIDPDSSGQEQARFVSYSINMLSSNAAPEWSGELFYEGTGGTSVNSTTSAASTLMGSAAEWQAGAPSWLTSQFNVGNGTMVSDAVHNTNLAVAVWRPASFIGTPISGLSAVTPSGSATGGYVTDGNGNYYKNSMAWSGRATHYFDFSRSSWEPISSNHLRDQIALPLGNWKALEYAWHARAAGVTVFTVGYGDAVSPSEQIFLAQVANATNSTVNPATNITYNSQQPIGQQFYATTPAEISNDFYQVGTAINAALTQ